MTSLEDIKDSANKFWRYGNLGDRIEISSGPTGWDGRDGDRRWGNWRKFLQRWTESPPFVDGLSPPQKRSATILFDWYAGSFQSDDERSFSATFLEGNDPLGREAIVTPPLLRQAGSEYQISMLKLFFYEFDIDSWELQSGKRLVKNQSGWIYRRNASIHAAAQQLAFSVLHDDGLSPDVDLGCRSLGGSSLENCSWLADKNLEEENPTFLWDIEQKMTVKVKELGYCPPYTCISHTWGRLKKDNAPAVKVKGVNSWEVPQIKSYNVEDLPGIFERQKWKTKYLWFDLFCIPQDGKMATLKESEVSRQASIFGRCRECVVWLNDIEASWSAVQHALLWLSAKYFVRNHGRSVTHSRAAAVFAELGRVPQTGDIELLTTPLEPIPIKKYALWFSSTWTLQETFLCPHLVLVNKQWHPIPGANGCMIPLNSLISLIKCVKLGLGDINMDLNNGARSAKQFFLWLDHTYLDALLCPSQTGILSLGSSRECKKGRAVAVMSVLNILDWHKQKGNPKETERPPEEESKLIRGAYFHQFIQEAAQKTGPRFYNYISDQISSIDEFFVAPLFGTMMPFSTGLKAKPRNKGIEETSPPVFGAKSDQKDIEKRMPMAHEPIFEKEGTWEIMPVVKEHHAVASWNIQLDGQVKIMSVGILASVDVTRSYNYACDKTIQFSMISCLYEARGLLSLGDLLAYVCVVKGQPNWFRPSYIVSLFINEPSRIHYCTLLQGKAVESEDASLQSGHVKLVRTALLHSGSYAPLPPTTEVDWTVL